MKTTIVRYTLLLLILALLASACGKEKKVTATNTPAERPAWIDQRPVNNGYYIGIGSSSKTSQPLDYQAIAKKNAMADLTSEIKVRVQGSTFLNSLEVNKNFSEEFISNITTTSDEKIEDFEVAGVYETKTDFWIYYRLSKAEYQSQKMRAKQSAMSMANDYFVRGQEAEGRNDLRVAMDQYFHGLFALREYWDEENTFLTDKGSVYLDHELYSRIQSIVTGIQLSAPERVDINAQNDFTEKVAVKAMYKGQPVSGVVVNYRYPREKFSRIKTVATDAAGLATIDVENIDTAAPNKSLNLEIDIESWLPNDLDVYTEKGLMKSVTTDKKVVPINFTTPSFFVKSNEKMYGTPTEAVLQKKAQAALIGKGLRITANEKSADYILELRAETTNGQATQGFFVAFLNLQTTVIKVTSGEAVFQDVQSEIKGVQLSQAAAGTDAYKKGESKLEEQIVPAMIKAIL